MEYKIDPFRGFGDVAFGMTSNAARSCMRSEFQSFKRAPLDEIPSDHFPAEGVLFYYDSVGLLEAVEFARPAKPTIGGIDLLNLTFEQSVSKLAALDRDIRAEMDGAIAYNLGISVWAPLAKENSKAAIESVLAFRRGYYN